MVEPLSLAGILIAIPSVATALITIASDIKEARKDMQNLVGDLFTLKGVLECEMWEHREDMKEAEGCSIKRATQSDYIHNRDE